MRPLSFVRRNPLPVLGASVVAFAAWVFSDSTGSQGPDVNPVSDVQTLEIIASQFAVQDGPPIDREPVRVSPQTTAHALPKLKPGMTRSEVEGLVGAPAAGHISPATVQDGRITYHAQYEADLAPVATVRPIGRGRFVPQPPVPPVPSALVTLEFDATKPGHPLVGVHYPDPLF